MVLARIAACALLLHATVPLARPALLHRSKSSAANRASAITLRKRLHVNTLITAPGSMEVEWGGAFSVDGSFTFPASIRFTPEGTHAYWGRTELSASFDSLSSSSQSGDRVTHFGDRATFAANCVVHDGARLDFAVAPQASFLLRGDAGVRLGATAIARYDAGRSSAGVALTWTAATTASATNPAGTLDLGVGYGFRLKPSGPLGHLTPHINVLYERSTGSPREVSLFEGVEYQITEKVAIDFSGQHLSVWGGAVNHQIAAGLTVNLGRVRGQRRQASQRHAAAPLLAKT